MSEYIPPPNFDRNSRPTLEYLDDLNAAMMRRCVEIKIPKRTILKSPILVKMWKRVLHIVWKLSEYALIVTIPPIFLFLALFFVFQWASTYRGGIAMVSSPDVQFNLHPILMVASLITLNGLGMLMFRFCKCANYQCNIAMHIVVHGFTLIFAIIGTMSMKSTQEQKAKMTQKKPEADQKSAVTELPMWEQFESIHAHLGAATLIFYAVHFLVCVSGLTFLPCFARGVFRESMAWIHSYLGFTNFMLAIGTACSGFCDYARIRYKNKGKISEDENQYLFNMCTYLLIVGFVIAIALRRSSPTFGARTYARS